MDETQAETPSDVIERENYPLFRNIEGRTREQRRANGKTVGSFKVESNLVGKLCGGRLVEEPLHHPLFIVEGSPSHADDAARFERDAAAAEFETRAEKLRKYEEYISAKRADKCKREAIRWAEIQQKQDDGEEALELHRMSGANAKKNVSGEHFNIVTLEYSSTQQGKHLEYLDNCQRYKDQMRANNLYSRGRSTIHNIITGEADHITSFLSPPERPTPPENVA